MGYDLIPRNKKIDGMSVGAFSWPVILQETGMGYVLGYGAGRSPATYVYKSGGKGSPTSNDGYSVSSAEAKMMAAVARGFCSVKRFINKEWEQMEEGERERSIKFSNEQPKPIYQMEVSEKFIEQVERFADFAEKSGGFTIN